MTYNVIVTQAAEDQLDAILDHVLRQFKNKQAARAILRDVEKTYEKLTYMADTLAFCNDPYLVAKKYRKCILETHNYLLLYQIQGNNVYINGIFHMLEDYPSKL